MKKLKTLSVLFFAISISFVSCKKNGCTDPSAYNYDSNANTDDGSCTYEGCTDPLAVNYDPNATVSATCNYDQIGSWTSTSQDIDVTVTATLFGMTVYDTSFTESAHPDSLDPSGLEFIESGSGIAHHNDEPSDSFTWTQSGEQLTINTADTTMIFTIASVNATDLILTMNESESGTDPSTGADYVYTIDGTFTFIRD